MESYQRGLRVANYFDQYDQAQGNYFDQFDAPQAPPQQAQQEAPQDDSFLPTADEAISAVKGNLDIPLGIVGGILGSVGGPAGIVAGGGLGTAAGSAISDILTKERVDYNDVARDAGTSMAFDVATMGAFKYAKPILTKLGFKPDDMIKAVSSRFGKVADAAPPPNSMQTGSPGSLSETQSLLREGGGSLSAYQTGKAGVLRRVSEGLGDVGVISSQAAKNRAVKNNQIIGVKLEQLMNDGLTETSDDIGMLIHGIVKGGKDATQQLYREGLDSVQKMAGNKVVPVVPLRRTLEAFRDSGAREFGSIYDSGTLNHVNDLIKGLDGVPSMSVSSMLDYQKKLNSTISQLGEFGATQNTRASAELADLSSKLRETTETLLKNTDSKAFEQYSSLNKMYGEAMDGILPKLNANFIKQADKGNYESIARLMVGSNPDQITKMMASIDKSYAQAKIAGLAIGKETGLETADQAKGVIRNAYMRNIFGDITAGSFDSSSFARYADKFDNPRAAKAATAVLGKQFVPFKRLLNAMAESTQKQQGFIGSLVLRGKEAQGLQLLAGGAAAAANPAVAAAIFLTPVALGKIASNPKAVDALLDLNAKTIGPKGAAGIVAASDLIEAGVNDIIDKYFTEQDKEDIRMSLLQP